MPHFDAYTVPSLSDDVARDSLIHIPAEDELEVAKLPFKRKQSRKHGNDLDLKKVIEALIEFSKENFRSYAVPSLSDGVA